MKNFSLQSQCLNIYSIKSAFCVIVLHFMSIFCVFHIINSVPVNFIVYDSLSGFILYFCLK